MSKLGINTGSTPNDGTGDNLLSGAIKINSNFDELYTALGDGTTLGTPVTSIVAGTNVSGMYFPPNSPNRPFLGYFNMHSPIFLLVLQCYHFALCLNLLEMHQLRTFLDIECPQECLFHFQIELVLICQFLQE